MKINCEECGQDFEAFPSKRRRFCSKSCSSRVTIRSRLSAGRTPRARTGQVHACRFCGSDVYVRVYREKQSADHFCSKDCATKWQARNSVVRPCEWCGSEMTMSPFRSKLQRFCSRQCQREGVSRTALEREHNGLRVRQTSEGYIYVWEPDNPSSYKDGWMPEHRLVMQNVLGRPLEPDEYVHHKNQRKDDNRIANLELMTPAEHRSLHIRLDKALTEIEEYQRRFGPL